MRTLALVVGMTGVLAAQSGGAQFAGSWAAQFEGRTFIRLELKAANGTFTGGISLGDIELDKQGALKRVGELPRELSPIIDVAQRASVLAFSMKDGDDTDRFELRLLASGRAELAFLLDKEALKEIAASGIPAPKPIPLTRQ